MCHQQLDDDPAAAQAWRSAWKVDPDETEDVIDTFQPRFLRYSARRALGLPGQLRPALTPEQLATLERLAQPVPEPERAALAALLERSALGYPLTAKEALPEGLPRDPAAGPAVARLLRGRGRYVQALAVLEQAEAAGNRDPSLQRLRASCLTGASRWAEAEALLVELTAAEGPSADDALSLALLARLRGELDASVAAARRAVEEAPDDPDALFALAMGLHRARQPQEAAEVAALGVAQAGFLDPQLNLLVALQTLERAFVERPRRGEAVDEALGALCDVICAWPASEPLLIGVRFGSSLPVDNPWFDAARGWLGEFERVAPKSPEVPLWRGLFLLRGGAPAEQVLDRWRHAIRSSGRDLPPRFYRAWELRFGVPLDPEALR
jgi:tetratricopeptide (TPR) repeat protein